MEKIPQALAAMLEEGVEFLTSKYSSESTELWEELAILERLMDALINRQEEELERQRGLFEKLMGKHRTLLKDLLDLSQKYEETQERLTNLEDSRRSQARTIEDLESKLALETGAKVVKEEMGGQSAGSQEPTQTFSASPSSLVSIFSTDDEEEEEDMKKLVKVKEEAQSPPSSPFSCSLLRSVSEEVKGEELVVFSSDPEADSDNDLTIGED